jgi:hypothetical protein
MLTEARDRFRSALRRRAFCAAVFAFVFVFRVRKSMFRKVDPAVLLPMPGTEDEEQPGTSLAHRKTDDSSSSSSSSSEEEEEAKDGETTMTKVAGVRSMTSLPDVSAAAIILRPVVPLRSSRRSRRGHQTSDPDMRELSKQAQEQDHYRRVKHRTSFGEEPHGRQARAGTLGWQDLAGSGEVEEQRMWLETAKKASPPEPPMPPPLEPNATRDQYKAYMVAKYEHEQWENAVLLLSLKMCASSKKASAAPELPPSPSTIPTSAPLSK